MRLSDDTKKWIGLIGFLILGVSAAILCLINRWTFMAFVCLLVGARGMCRYDEHYPLGKAYKRRQEASHGDG